MRKVLAILFVIFVCNECFAAGNNWLAAARDNTFLSQLSIPGTHDSGALYEPLSGTAKCQNLTITQQLDAGIRFLDIRCRHYENAFVIHHGQVYQNQNFDGVLDACISFLTANPSETIIMSVKEEYDAYNNSRSFEESFNFYVNKNPDRWYTGTKIPNLGTVRGKIVLFRRFPASNTGGLNASNWADDTTFNINNDAKMRVQDNYSNGSGSEKWTDVSNMLNEANNGNAGTLYVNFSSGYTSFIGIPSITSVSNYVNPRLETFFSQNSNGRFGIIVMDFANANRANLIYQSNTFNSDTATTKAYWRFEDGSAGQYVQHLASNGTYSHDIYDVSGNNNSLAVWETGPNGGYTYSSKIPYNTIANTIATNQLSVKNSGDAPTMFCRSSSMLSWSPRSFTLECTVKFQNGGYRTYIGRDSFGTNSNNDLAALYLQAIPNNGLAFKFCDVAGNWHEAVSANNIIQSFDNNSNPNGNGVPWYSIAAVSDGSMMALYLLNHSNNNGYQLIAQNDISSSSNPSLTTGSGSGTNWQAGTFTVGRGLYGSNHTDRGLGYIDEVRLTNGALDTLNLLHSRAIHAPAVSQNHDQNGVSATLNWSSATAPNSNSALDYIADQYIFFGPANGTMKFIGSTGDPGTNAASSFTVQNLANDTQYNWQIVDARIGAESSLSTNSSTISNVNGNSIFGTVWSFTSIAALPVITTQPHDILADQGDTVTFSTTASSTSPLTYAWYYSDNTEIGNDSFIANGPNLLLTNISTEYQGYFFCKITNNNNDTIYSNFAQLEVRSLVNWFKFDNTLSDSIGSNDGYAPNDQPSFSAGMVNYGVAFNGTNQYIEISNPTQNSFTISFWVKTTDIGGTGGWWEGTGLIDGEMPNSVNDFGTVIRGNKFGFGIGNPDTTISSISDINDGKWHHCAAARDNTSGKMSIYIDGQLENETSGPTGKRDSTQTLSIGKINNAANYFTGQIDELKIFNYPLNEFEIANEYSTITSKTVCIQSLKPESRFDLNNDCTVDVLDLSLLVGNWLACGQYPTCFDQ